MKTRKNVERACVHRTQRRSTFVCLQFVSFVCRRRISIYSFVFEILQKSARGNEESDDAPREQKLVSATE